MDTVQSWEEIRFEKDVDVGLGIFFDALAKVGYARQLLQEGQEYIVVKWVTNFSLEEILILKRANS